MDDEWDKYLDDYIDDIVFCQIPNNLQFYFDDERWKEDQKNGSTRGNDLSHNNGEELEYTLDGTTYYAYIQ